MTQKLNERGPGTAHDFILRGVDKWIETAVEERDDDERVQDRPINAYHAPCCQCRVHLVRQVVGY